MPWQPNDAESFTRTATTKKARDQWADVANSELKRTGDDGLAVKAANGVIKKRFKSSAPKIGETKFGSKGRPKKGPRKVIRAKE